MLIGLSIIGDTVIGLIVIGVVPNVKFVGAAALVVGDTVIGLIVIGVNFNVEDVEFVDVEDDVDVVEDDDGLEVLNLGENVLGLEVGDTRLISAEAIGGSIIMPESVHLISNADVQSNRARDKTAIHLNPFFITYITSLPYCDAGGGIRELFDPRFSAVRL